MFCFPYYQELINIAKKIKTPSLTVYLKPHCARDHEAAKNVQCSLQHTTLRDVTSATEIHYDPDPLNTIIEEDSDFVRAYFDMPDEEINSTQFFTPLPPQQLFKTNGLFSIQTKQFPTVANLSPWLLRIELNHEKMADTKLTMTDIAEHIHLDFGGDLNCIYNYDNAEKLILRIRIMNDEANKQPDEENSGNEDVLLLLKQIDSHMLTEMSLKV